MNNVVPELPSYTEEHLARLDADALLALMIGDEDRVPRNVIDTAARRGGDMATALGSLLELSWSEREDGEWWLWLHAVMILGLMDQENAGLLLVRFMRRMSEEDDTNLQDWLAGHWQALFANKPASVLPALRELCGDPALYWYIRSTPQSLAPNAKGVKPLTKRWRGSRKSPPTKRKTGKCDSTAGTC